MPHPERTQKNAPMDPDELKGVVVRPLPPELVDDRVRNAKDIEPDTQAMSHGIEHGGSIETHAEQLSVRGSGGRKRSQTSPRSNKHHGGRDLSKKR